jgi:hypothetical protein
MSISVLVTMDVSFGTVSLGVKCFTIGDLSVRISVLKTTLKSSNYSDFHTVRRYISEIAISIAYN